jgi:hypothetical protein
MPWLRALPYHLLITWQTSPHRLPHMLFMGLAVATSAAFLSACGSSGPSNATAASNQYAQGLKFSDCMRSHGITNFPDPSTRGGGIDFRITPSSGITPFSPALKAAQKACRHLLPGGGPDAGHPSAQVKAQMLAISTCMRSHGITDFPDPTTTPPSSPNGTAGVLGRDGVFLVLPNSINTNSPAFKQAASACHFPGGP